MLLSIITINYNNCKGLKRTIDSVVSQTFRDFEWIVIDGGSTDGSKELVEQYADHFAYWVSEPDKGIYNAMNKGIRVAKGEYLFFLNSGDWLKDKESLQFATSSPFKEDVICFPLVLDYGNRMEESWLSQKITLYTFIHGAIYHSGSSFIRRALFDEYGLYDENLRIVSDWKFFLQAIGLGDATVRVEKECISVFDMNGVCTVQMEANQKERQKVLQELLPARLLEDYQDFKNCNDKLMQQELKIRSSKPYRLGYAVLKPIKVLKRVFAQMKKS